MEFQQAIQIIEKYVRPQTFPVAVRLIQSDEAVAGKAKQPKQDFGAAMPVCQGIALARRYGWSLAMGQEDMLCPLGSLTLGFVPAKQKILDGEFNIQFWVKDQAVRARMTQNMPRLTYGRFSRILMAPAHRADFEPQVVIFYGNPAQLARFVQSAVYATGEAVSSPSTGGFACGGEITQPFLSDECQLVMTGGGDRAIAQSHDHEAAFAIPASRLESIAQGLEATHKAGMRYPTPSFLLYQAHFPPVFSELMDYLENEEQ
ncbi:MAG: DUF169 domain-containing protein [Desulfobacterales bacterium]|nr:DUF169 domain-containing protein [Desulfobacterales bacterium]